MEEKDINPSTAVSSEGGDAPKEESRENVSNEGINDTFVSNEASSEGNSEENAGESIKDTINKITGRNYKTDEDALKGVEETFKYVGKAGKEKPVASQPTNKNEEVAQKLKELEVFKKQTEFFKQNPEYEPYKDLLGDDPQEAIKNEKLKKLIDDSIALNKDQSKKSVIHSNARVAADNSDRQKDFEKARKTGDWSEYLRKYKGIGIKDT